MNTDKQRIDLSRMGIWGKKIRVECGDAFEEVWVQTIGDRSEAIERGHEAMQKKLLEFRPGSERTAALNEALMLAPVGDLIELVLEAERAQMEKRIAREIPDPIRPRQDVAASETGESFVKRTVEFERQCEELAQARGKRLEERLAERRCELALMPKEELVELARPRRIDIECWNAFTRTCDDWVLFAAVRKAEEKEAPYFHDIAQVCALHPAVKEQLRRAYRELEPSEGDMLPKCCAATPSSA